VEKLLHDMDECNIDQALVMSYPYASNKFLSTIVKSHPRRLIGFARVTNPRDGTDSVRELEIAINELGLKGLKLLPECQAFSPADREILPLIRRASELDVPILIHSAPGYLGSGYFTYSLPEHFDILKKRVPEANLIIGHMGGPRFWDLLTIAPRQGIYLDTSLTLPTIVNLLGIDFATRFIRRIGVDNVLFGTDWVGSLMQIREQQSILKRMRFTKIEKEKILGNNIGNIIGLN